MCTAKYKISAMTNNMIETTPNICPARENAFLRVVKFCPDSQEKAIAMIASMMLQPQKKDTSPNMNSTTEVFPFYKSPARKERGFPSVIFYG